MPPKNALATCFLLLLMAAMACSLGDTITQPVPLEQGKATRVSEEAAATEAPAAAAEAPPAAPPPGAPLTRPDEKAYEDMFFKNYGVNPFIDTEDDHLSTFALDVDTGSYTIARRYLDGGSLPPEDAIRVEEFVNYFDQDYPYPPEGQAFAIHFDGAPFPFAETERYRMLRVGIQGYAVAPEARQDVSLVFVIDVSGSMNRENRLELVKASLELLVEQLRPSDSVAIVVYGSEARIVLEPTSGAETGAILEAIYALQPEGSTNAEAGLRLGYQEAMRAFKPEGINRVILCSDGVANVGATGPQSILETIKGYASEGVTLTTVGFGMGNYNDVLMEQLADGGDGFYAYVDGLKEAERLFVENLTSTLQAIALDAKVQVDFNPEVVARYRLIGFENRAIADEEFRDDTVDAGEIGAGHSVTALYEIKLHPDAQGRAATVYLRWQDPATHQVIELNQDFDTGEMAESFSEASPHLQRSVVVAEFAEILRGSYWAEGSTLAGVLEEAERVSSLLPDDPDMAELVGLVSRANRMADTTVKRSTETPAIRSATLTPSQTPAPTATPRPTQAPTPQLSEVTPSKVYTLTSPQATVDAMSSLTLHLQIPDRFMEGDSVKTDEDFDVNTYFTVFDHLSMEPGYVLDYVYMADDLGGKPLIYARPSDQVPYATYAEYVEAGGGAYQRSYEVLEHAYDYLEHVQADDTAEGYFQFVVLATMGDQFYLYWHALYNDTTIICDREGMERALAAADGFLGEGERVPLDVRQRAEALDFEPTVELKDDMAVVRFVVFTKWGGFFEVRHTISREFPHALIDSDGETLVEYDCGVAF